MEQGRDREFADALRDAVEARGLSLERIRAHLLAYGHDVSVATLSYWQTGRSVPLRRASLQALGALEAILQVPRGALASRLPTQHGRRVVQQTLHPIGTHPAYSDANRIAEDMGLAFHDGYEVVTQEQTIRIDEHRHFVEAAADTTIIATRDGLDRILLGYRSDVPGVLLTLDAVSGCRIGRVAVVLRETLTVTEVLFDQRLRAGEPYRYRMAARHDQPGVDIRVWERVQLRPIPAASLTLSFATAQLPQCWLYVGPNITDPDFTPVALTSSEITVSRENFGPGIIAMRWDWPDEPQS